MTSLQMIIHYSTMIYFLSRHNQLNRGKKSILEGQCALFASKAKIKVFEISSSGGSTKETWSLKKFFQKSLILVFEVIVQPPITHIWNFYLVLAHCAKTYSKLQRTLSTIE